MLRRFPTTVGLSALAGVCAGFSDFHGALLIPAVPALLMSLWGIKGRRAAWKGFGTAFLAGAIAFAIQLNWLSVVSWLGAIVLPLYLALFWGVFGAFAATLGNPFHVPGRPRHWGITFANAAVWAFLEWLRGWLFTGFGWNGLGVALHDALLFAQTADILGIAGVSLLVVWTAGLLVISLSGKDRRDFLRSRDLAGALGLIALAAAYGGWRIHQEKGLRTTPLKALLVQINIPQEAAQRLWDPAEIHMAYEDDTLAALEVAETGGSVPDWVIWPESALSGRIMRTDDGGWGTWEDNAITLRNVREGGDFTLIYGVNELEAVAEPDGALVRKPDGKAYNSMAVMSPQDELQTFRKHHLVIFGETIPFVDSIPLLKKIYEQQAGVEYGGSFSPGTSFEPLTARAGGVPVGIIPSVCFEDTVPRLLRRFVRPGPQVIVNVTNDGWFKESKAADQHFANAVFRAIELRRPMVRCANTGVSAAISSTGSTADPATGKARVLTGPPNGDHFTRGTLHASLPIPLDPPTTLYSLIGDWGIIVCGGAAVLYAARFRKARSTENEGMDGSAPVQTSASE